MRRSEVVLETIEGDSLSLFLEHAHTKKKYLRKSEKTYVSPPKSAENLRINGKIAALPKKLHSRR
jgi:hypothetical protein